MLAPERSAEVATLLQEGIGAAKAGDKETARQKIQRATELEPNNEAAWLWLASLYTEPNVSAYCLQRAVAINPTNEKAAKALSKLQQQIIVSQNAALHPEAFGDQRTGAGGRWDGKPAQPADPFGWSTSVGQQGLQAPAADPGYETPAQELGFEELKRRGL